MNKLGRPEDSLNLYLKWRDARIASGESDVNPFAIWNAGWSAGVRFGRDDGGWIPVGESLPNRGEEVLVWSDSNGMHRASLCSDGQWLDEDFNPGKKITHWRPLPPPPATGSRYTLTDEERAILEERAERLCSPAAGSAWSKDKPTTEGFYLYRDSRGQCLMQVGRYKDLQQGMPDALYAYPQSAGRSKSMGFDTVERSDGEWINVTHLFRENVT